MAVEQSIARIVMNTKPLLLWFVLAATAFAGDPPADQYNHQYQTIPVQPLSLDEAIRLPGIATVQPALPPVTLGTSDFVISGPLVYALRPLPAPAEHLSLPQKFLRLPIIRLAVPGPMEKPPGTGKYFAWRDTDDDQPWEARVSRPELVKGPD